MNLFFLRSASKQPRIQSEEHPVVHVEPLHNTNEGSEFLDDAIRDEDLPPTYTEESVAAGSPRNLL